MRSNLSFNDRREQILSYLAVRKKTTRFELASEFCVSLDTIDRDLHISAVSHRFTPNRVTAEVYTYYLSTGVTKIISPTQRRIFFTA